MKKNAKRRRTARPTARALERLLRQAERAHAVYEKKLGVRDEDWPRWYAAYLAERLAHTSPRRRGKGVDF